MLIFKLAMRNLLGAGLRTWLNVLVLSFSFVAIIWTQGLYDGMNKQTSRAMIDEEYGGGQYWQSLYDPYDPLNLDTANDPPPDVLQKRIGEGTATPILIIRGTIFPNGREKAIQIKGIAPDQDLLNFPTRSLAASDEEETGAIPALIGNRMSKNTGLKKDSIVTLRWRDRYGTFDARDIKIVHVMHTMVQSIDRSQIWVPLRRLQELTALEGEATMVVLKKESAPLNETPAGWSFQSVDTLLSDLREMLQSKTVGATILYFILLFLAMLAIFDTQVLSIFKRKKEMGTIMAMGMTRGRVIQLFTLEGALHGVLAALMATLYGVPLLVIFSKTGWAMPQSADDWGFSLGTKLFPSYSVGLILGTVLLVMVITTIVSYLPTRKIAKLKPTEALRGTQT